MHDINGVMRYFKLLGQKVYRDGVSLVPNEAFLVDHLKLKPSWTKGGIVSFILIHYYLAAVLLILELFKLPAVK